VSDWLVDRHRASAAGLHESSARLVAAADPTSPDAPGAVLRRIRVLEAETTAIVLGRAEPEDHVDRSRTAAAGIAIARRSSGGGAVMVGPAEGAWVDILIPADDPLWSADVGRAMWWVGEAWVAALREVGRRDAEVWRGALRRNEWSDRVCFAGLGPGEVTVPGGDGRLVKVVGVSQRRTRRGALFQCAVVDHWDPPGILDLLALPDARRRAGADELAGAAVGVGERTGALVEAVIAHVAGIGRARPCDQLP
jgi:lipoate-protein ligase A